MFAVLPDADTTEAKCGEFGLQDIQKNKSSEWGDLLYTAARFCFVSATTGAGWAVYNGVIIEG